MKKGEFEFKQIVTALIVIIVLILIIMFLTNIDKLKDVLLKLSSFG
tara:strand:- start:153 stop:290 length:138 start_codon:yes stop_codon:yes gene_type:complete